MLDGWKELETEQEFIMAVNNEIAIDNTRGLLKCYQNRYYFLSNDDDFNGTYPNEIRDNRYKFGYNFGNTAYRYLRNDYDVLINTNATMHIGEL